MTFVADTTGVITARAITVTAQTDTKGYDGTTFPQCAGSLTAGMSPRGAPRLFTQTLTLRTSAWARP